MTRTVTANTAADQHLIMQQRWAEHGWGGDEQVAAYSVLNHTPRLVYQYVDKALEPIGLTGSRHAILWTLDCSPAGELTIGQISRRVLSHPTSVTKLVDHLEAAGLVRKTVPSYDRRAVVVALTANGTDILEEAGHVLAESKFGLGALDAMALKQLTSALETVRRHLMRVVPD